ncbi:M23 family metallopeptidase [Primorskyibacter marinus]|uniref:M23 family metallopeptidase n=1 Tax=Primorskyibacter marinus TaxID=1977320 RepID=UPI000E308727|nr:M23 family metallopeptidase [Primorskyibacter marinus]
MFRHLAAIAISLAATSAAGEFSLQTPVDCTLGDTCHIQHYMDRAPGPEVQDFLCGALSYDGHQGTDFALATIADMQKGVAVLAAADGTVRATRDGMADRVFADADMTAIDGRDCGNGVVIDHADGWQTQYCHMRRGSIAVQQGQTVAAGQQLGTIGLSGRTQFPHLHLTLRRDGTVVDPFEPNGVDGCGGADAPALWQDQFPSFAGGIIDVGLAEAVPDYSDIKAGKAGQMLSTASPAMVVFGLAYGGQKGDMIEMTLTGPEGRIIRQSVTLDKPQAQFFRATGRKRSGRTWPRGLYHGTIRLFRGGVELNSRSVQQTVR